MKVSLFRALSTSLSLVLLIALFGCGGGSGSHLVSSIPGAEHFSIPAGSHYSAIEYPEILNLRLDKFFRDHFRVK